MTEAWTEARPVARRIFRRWALLIAAASLVLRLFQAPGPVEADDFLYAVFARDLAEGTLPPGAADSYYFHRFGLWVPAAGGIALLGEGPLGPAAWPLLCHLLLILAILLAGGSLFGPGDRRTLAALALLALNPLEAVAAGRLLPDGPFAAFAALALACHLRALGGAKAAARWWIAAGLAAYAAFLVRSPGMLLLAWGLVDLAARRRLPRAALAAPAAFLLCQGVAMLLYWRTTGDPFWRQRVLMAAYAAETPGAPPPALLLAALAPRSLLSGTLLLGAAAAVMALRRRQPGRGCLLLFSLFWLLFHELGSMSLGEYRPIVKEIRFLTVLAAPLALLTAGAAIPLAAAGRTWRRPWRAVLPALLALYIVHGTYAANRAHGVFGRVAAKYEAVGRYLRDHPAGRPVYVIHGRWELRLTWLVGRSLELRALPPPERWGEIREGTVILDHGFHEAGWRNPDWPRVPAAWERRLTFARGGRGPGVEVFRPR